MPDRTDYQRGYEDGVRAAADACDASLRAVLAELDQESREEAQEYGYIRAPREASPFPGDRRKWRGFRDGWTLYGFAKNELVLARPRALNAIRALLPTPPAQEGSVS